MRPPSQSGPHAKRAFAPAEEMLDALDRASTCNFTCAVQVRGVLSESAITRALRALERRHPLLRARVVRGTGTPELVPGEGAPIPLQIVDGPLEAWKHVSEAALSRRDWPDDGPRAELTWVRHAAARSTLHLACHHIASDGTSGMIALRDLLMLVAEPNDATEPVPAPSQVEFYPRWFKGFRGFLRALVLVLKGLFLAKPRRIRDVARAPLGMRRVHLDSLQLEPPVTSQLRARAKQDGVSVHALLCAAMAQAICVEIGEPAHQRILHPIDLRRYFREFNRGGPEIGEAFGYYVSGVYTDHDVGPRSSLLELAREIAERLREKKASGEPLLAASHLGPFLTRITRRMPRARFRQLVENQIFLGTFLLSNLGRVETAANLPEQIGAVRIENAWFALAGSVMHALLGATTMFRGTLNLHLTSVQPFVSTAAAARVLAGVERRLRQYAPVTYVMLSPNEDTYPQRSKRVVRQRPLS